MENELIIPQDMLIAIFSYLNIKDLLNVSTVCKHWRNISRIPLLWKNLDVKVSERNILSFCEFMKSYIHVEIFYFSVIKSDPGLFYQSSYKVQTYSSLECQTLNNMIKNWTRLKCLRLPLGIKFFLFPPSLKHISYYNAIVTPYYEVNNDILSLTNFCPLIEHISFSFEFVIYSTDEVIKYFLENKKLTLKSLAIDCKILTTRSLSCLVDCLNLTKLSLNNVNSDILNYLALLAELKYLDYLYLKSEEDICEYICISLKSCTFKNLTQLIISSKEFMTRELILC